MSTNHTPNYSLSQWQAADQVLRTDFNEDNAALEAALGFAFHRELTWETTVTEDTQQLLIDPTQIPWSDYQLVVMRIIPGEFKNVTFTIGGVEAGNYAAKFSGTLLATGNGGSYSGGTFLGEGSLDTCTHVVFFTHRAPLYRPWVLMFCYTGVRVSQFGTLFSQVKSLSITGGPLPAGTKVQFWGIR